MFARCSQMNRDERMRRASDQLTDKVIVRLCKTGKSYWTEGGIKSRLRASFRLLGDVSSGGVISGRASPLAQQIQGAGTSTLRLPNFILP